VGHDEAHTETMELERDDVTNAIDDHVRELNEFFNRQKLRRGTQHGYVRNLPQWRQSELLLEHGRTVHYQVMSAAMQLKMTVSGQSIVEIDIRASYLTSFSLCTVSAS
jgi:hypothetical protein